MLGVGRGHGYMEGLSKASQITQQLYKARHSHYAGISFNGKQISTVEMTKAAEAKICPGSSSRKSAARRDLDLSESSLRTPQLTCAYPPPVHALHTVQRNLGIKPLSPHVCWYGDP